MRWRIVRRGTIMEEESISFEDLGLDETTLAAVARKGFVTPSPIQVLAIPRLLNGEANVIARARTGTGKTAAFGLPLVQKLLEGSDHVQAIILEPTRELAMQTCTEMSSFTTGQHPRTAVVYGGASMGEQIRDLRRGVEIVVGTPGRVQDLIDRGVLKIDKIEFFILDEGDEMLDMGFVDDIEKIFSSANATCRVLLFSATMPAPILKIAQKFMGEYEIVEEEGHEEEPLLIEQKYWIVRQNEKIEALIRLIDFSPDFYGLVFVQKKTDADYVSKVLDEKGYQVAALHGDVPQSQREKILARFRAKKTRILVATDVAARGIDIEGLTHVVNYELPFDGPTYVHRIGRTGRAGAAGCAVTFVRPEERRRMEYLRAAIRRSSKGEMSEGSIPSVDEVIDVQKVRLFDQVKEKLGLKLPEEKKDDKAEKKAAKKNIESDDDELIPLPADAANAASTEDTTDAEATQNADAADDADNTEDSVATDEATDADKSADAEDDAQSSDDDEVPLAPTPHLRKGDPVFDQLAAELCVNQNPQEVLASLLAATYGNSLSKSRYGRINDGGAGKRGVAVGADQIRVYVQLGWHDGYNPRGIADFFSDLLHIPGKLVDQIDMADKFCLVSLPIEAGKKALALSESDHSLPHMHQDVKAGGEGRGGRGGRGGFGGGRGGDRGFGGRGDSFGGRRGGYGSHGDGEGRGGRGGRGGFGGGRGRGDSFGGRGDSFGDGDGRRSRPRRSDAGEGSSFGGVDTSSFGSTRDAVAATAGSSSGAERRPFGEHHDRYAVGKSGDERRRSSSGRGGSGGHDRGERSARGGSHTRANVHTATERSASAGLYKKKSGAAEEY